jgi:serine/threonine protein kinase
MSPEHENGQQVDAHSDIWSAGITLFELLTGSWPYSGPSSNSVFDQIFHSPVPQIIDDWQFQQDLNHIFALALTKERQARYSSAAALAHDLRMLLPVVESWRGTFDNRDAEIKLADQVTLDQLPQERELCGQMNGNSVAPAAVTGLHGEGPESGTADESMGSANKLHTSGTESAAQTSWQHCHEQVQVSV